MIPGNTLSSQFIDNPYIYPDDLKVSKIKDYEMGGRGLQDASTGLQVQVWTLEVQNGTDAVISSPNTAATKLFSLPSLTEVSLAFDQNMFPFVAYVSQGNAGYYWYDATVSAFKFSSLPTGTKTPRCCLDDKRDLATRNGTSDILLTYLNNANWFFRMQRDRYGVEYFLKDLSSMINPELIKLGMDQEFRVRFKVQDALFQ